MSKIFKNYRSEIKTYCVKNGLSFDKLRTSPCCYDDEILNFLYDDPNERGIIERDGMWIIDDRMLSPITLEIHLESGKLRFVQTDITHKYLGVDREAARPVAKRPKVPNTPVRKLAYA